MVRGILAVTVALLLFGAAPLTAQTRQQGQGAARSGYSGAYIRANAGVVGIISGSVNSTSLHMTDDLLHVLDQGDKLRIVPMIGKGSVQSVRDILYLRGTDIGIVQSDVLNYFRKKNRLPGIESRLRYIAKLHNEEVHVLSRMKYLCLDDLAGKKVNFGIKGSGSAMTAQIVFDAHKVKVQPVFLDQVTALEALKKGQIAATVVVSGKPSPIFDKIKYTSKVHFLDLEFVGPLKNGYLPAVMTHDDYPDLIARNETVSTVSVSAVMAVYNWKTDSDRYRKVARFVNAFFSNFEKLQKAPHHKKWREVRIEAEVPGWTRLTAAEQWLKRHGRTQTAAAGARPGEVRSSFQKFLASKGGDQTRKLTGKEKEALFQQFVRWMKSQKP